MSRKPFSCARENCDEDRVYYGHLCREHMREYQRERYQKRKVLSQELVDAITSESEREWDEQESARLLQTYGSSPIAEDEA
jgi:hypothetical protein